MQKPRSILAAVLALTACTSEASESPPYTPVADVRQLMASVIEPAAEVYWDAVGTIIDENGTTEIRPQSEEEWEAVVNAAYVVAESGNLLLMPERVEGREGWVAMSRAMTEVARQAIEAATARNESGVFDVGAELYYTCTACHSQYAVETLRPNDERGN